MERFLLGALYIFHLVVGRNLGPAEQNITKLSSVQKVHHVLRKLTCVVEQ